MTKRSARTHLTAGVNMESESAQTPPANGAADFEQLMAALRDDPSPASPGPRARPKRPGTDPGLVQMFPIMDSEEEIAQRAPMNDYPMPDELVADVRNSLGLKKESWDLAKTRALKELGKLPWKLTGIRALSLIMFDSIQRVETTMEAAERIITAPKGQVTDELRVTAGTMMANCAKGLKDLAAQTLVTLEKGIDPQEANGKGQKPKNRPPQFGVQVNIGAPQPAPPLKAINDSKTVDVQ